MDLGAGCLKVSSIVMFGYNPDAVDYIVNENHEARSSSSQAECLNKCYAGNRAWSDLQTHRPQTVTAFYSLR